MKRADNKFASVSGVVVRENKVLLVRQSYGSAKGFLVVPGGYLSKVEMPGEALVREVLEETRITVAVEKLLAIRFSRKNWWAIFCAEYVSGEPKADVKENSEAMFIDIDEALSRNDVTQTTKEILRDYKSGKRLCLSDFCPKGIVKGDYQLFI